MKTFKELEKEVFDIGMIVVSNGIKTASLDRKLIFDDFFSKFCEFNNLCIKIAETKAFEIQTLKSAKQAINVFRIGMRHLSGFVDSLKFFLQNDMPVKELLKDIFKVKNQFEKMLSVMENYQFKDSNFYYEILQDKKINELSVEIVSLFNDVCVFIEKENKYGSFVADLNKLTKRGLKYNSFKTFDLENADVVSKVVSY